jgi:tetratricopeptide (TPR) repeat protein
MFPAIFAAVFLIQSFAGLKVESGTCDELGAHVPSGILYWRSGEFAGGLSNPPLGQLLAAAGRVALGTDDRPLAEEPRDLWPARVPGILLGVFTVLIIGRLGVALGVPGAAVGALACASLCPNLLAHARLASLDLPVTAFFVLACALAWRLARTPDRMTGLFFAFAVGSACIIKHTALYLLPTLSLGGLLARGSPRERALRAVHLFGLGLAGTLVLCWLAYGAGGVDLLFPKAYWAGISGKLGQSRAGHFAYLWGERSFSGFPHYFVVALLVKVPLPILAFAAVGAASLARRRASVSDREGFVLFVLLPASVIFLAMSLVHRVDIGIRHILPVFPALLATAGFGMACLWRGRPAGRLASAVLGAWVALSALRFAPDHLAYFNELAGGPARGDGILIDSNIDWGQDEYGFRRWVASQSEPVFVNPSAPRTGLVAANVNAIRGILAPDDSKLRWLSRLEPDTTIGRTFRVYRVDESDLRESVEVDASRALDYARYLLSQSRAREAAELLARSDLSRHEELARSWHTARGEALLALGQLDEAALAAQAARDVDLAVEIAYRMSEARGVPWERRDAAERTRTFGSLWRRGKSDEAIALANRLSETSSASEARPYLDPRAPVSPPTLEHALFLRELGLEREALEELGRLLVEEPTREEALWLYGELVVRRKLGLTQYSWPEVDWSALAH